MDTLRIIVAKQSVNPSAQVLEMPERHKTRFLFPCGTVVYFPDEVGLKIDASPREYFDMKADAEFVNENVPEVYIVRD